MVEELYDQIYNDLEPFWARKPSEIREDASSWAMLLSIRNGSIRVRNKLRDVDDWMGRWADLIGRIPPEALPDVDLAFNKDDEAHIFVPWEKIQEYLNLAKRTSL